MKRNVYLKHFVAVFLALAFCFVLNPATSLAAAPPAPKGVKATAIKTTSVKLTWKKTSKAKSYTVYKKSGKKYVKAASTKKNYYTVKKLKPATKYTFKIAVKTAKGTSKLSKAVTVRTKSKAAAQPTTRPTTKPTPKPTAKPTPKPATSPKPTPTPAPTPKQPSGFIDPNLVGKWEIVSIGNTISMILDLSFYADGTYKQFLYSDSTITEQTYTSVEGNYVVQAGNKIVKYNLIATDGDKNGIKSTRTLNNQTCYYLLGTNEYGRYFQDGDTIAELADSAKYRYYPLD